MRVPQISGDMWVKIALGVAVLGAAWYAVSKVSSAITGLSELPSRAWEGVKASAKDGGAAFLDQYAENPAPTASGGTVYGGKYNGPLVNDQGMDFGQLSG